MANLNGKLIVVAAPSAAGKSTLIKKLRAEMPELLESVSCTTREPRENEVDGVHYHFLKDDAFKMQIENDDFVEWALVHDFYYGTSKTVVNNAMNEGKHLLFDFDVQGADSFKKIYGDKAKVIFIAPPNFEVLKQRLVERGSESQETLEKRLVDAIDELKRSDDFDYKIINDDITQAYDHFKKIVLEIIEG